MIQQHPDRLEPGVFDTFTRSFTGGLVPGVSTHTVVTICTASHYAHSFTRPDSSSA